VDPRAAGDQPATGELARTGTRADQRPVGLLALIAVVCVVGVSAGAVRAIAGRRITPVG
jgi:hypothetical protein